MRNLAGNPSCDQYIAKELTRARIQLVTHTHEEHSSHEVPWSITGKLGPFIFTRAWRYWIVEGLVPLAVAQELYGDPVGVTDIRVAGHCGCPSPEEYDNLYTADGHRVIEASERPKLEAFMKEVESALSPLPYPFVYSDDPRASTAQLFVDRYHIDSEIGLRIFADTLRKHGLDAQQTTAAPENTP